MHTAIRAQSRFPRPISPAAHCAAPATRDPGKLFTAHASLIVQQIGDLTAEKFATIRGAVVQMIQSS
jgi:hypothetical protein